MCAVKLWFRNFSVMISNFYLWNPVIFCNPTALQQAFCQRVESSLSLNSKFNLTSVCCVNLRGFFVKKITFIFHITAIIIIYWLDAIAWYAYYIIFSHCKRNDFARVANIQTSYPLTHNCLRSKLWWKDPGPYLMFADVVTISTLS